MKILLLTIGSRGDVEPYITLGQGLMAKGHQVDLCTASRFQPMVASHGLTYRYMTDELFKLMEGGAIAGMSNLVTGIKTAVKLMKEARPVNRQMIIDTIKAGLDSAPDLIIYHPKCLAAVSIAEKFAIPAVMSVLQPMIVKTSEFPPAGMPDLAFMNRLSYRLINMGYSQYAKELNQQRQRLLNLPALPKNKGMLSYSDGQPVPVLHAFSEHLVSRPKDWGDEAIITGYWQLKTDSDAFQPSKELTRFLDDGDKPVYIGFGSMIGKEPEKMAQIIIEAVTKAGVRAIVASGWGGVKMDKIPEDIFVVESVPHSWLFPRVSAVVHHGGAGTTAAGLLAGRPTLICPFFGDQPFWGKQIERHGLGPSPIKQKKLHADHLAAALKDLSSNPQYQANAQKMAEDLSCESGIDNAISWMEKQGILK